MDFSPWLCEKIQKGKTETNETDYQKWTSANITERRL